MFEYGCYDRYENTMNDMRDTALNLFGIAFMFTVIIGILVLVASRAAHLAQAGEDPWRAVVPRFYSTVKWYSAAHGGLSPFDTLKLIAVSLVLYFSFVSCCNEVFKFAFPPSRLAKKMDDAVTAYAKLKPNDVKCRQLSPNQLLVWHSAKATLSPDQWKQAEEHLEIAVGIKFQKTVIRRALNSVVITFGSEDEHEKSDILVEADDGTLHVVHGNGSSYVYVLGNAKKLEDCNEFKIGWVQQFTNINKRISEAIRFKSPIRHLIAYTPVSGERDESAIHNRFDDYRIREDENGDKVGDELFVAAPPVVAWVKEIQEQG